MEIGCPSKDSEVKQKKREKTCELKCYFCFLERIKKSGFSLCFNQKLNKKLYSPPKQRQNECHETKKETV